MPDRRGSKGSAGDLLPDSLDWARETWRDRETEAKLPSGGWMLRHAADRLGIDQGEVDRLLTNRTRN